MPNPAWLKYFQNGIHKATVSPSGKVCLEGEELVFKDDPLPVGTSVVVKMGVSGFFVCASVSEWEAARQERYAEQRKLLDIERVRLNALREDACASNALVDLPCKWDVGIKDVLSGLSANSWGDGRTKRTVEHILLLEPYVRGRLKRVAGDFLCTSANGSNGKRWSAQIIECRMDGDGQPYLPKVTCKACLALAQIDSRN